MSIVSFLAVPVIIIVAAVIIVSLFLHFVPIGLWISAMAAGVSVGIVNLIGMRLRRVVPSKIILPLVKANKAGLDVNVNQLEAHYLAGGDVDRVVDALIAAHRATMSLTFERACAIDLAGRDVLEAVQMSVNPKVIETPFISAVAQNGIELKVRARVTVRANIDRLVGGAGEATVIARVGEGIVTSVGSARDHSQVLENPDEISKTVLSKGLDAGTAFEILSIDIADVDVGRNIGARLQTDQAEADKQIAQAKAEERRAMAVAKEQEMQAYTQEMQAKVVEAQAEVPLALAQALREGKLGVMDYYNMKNIMADTDMRAAVAQAGVPKTQSVPTGQDGHHDDRGPAGHSEK
ncbi:flotillin-like protein FloA [uncultured Megasphaera sp.]|uniref:flotillin-like protein FloA n=1 Tax=uncultured Megasphaera sp. TaxID=165188 RepID=UPI0025CBFFD5|nr:flotillin-like protein FloA [uncultured Megasphaera sp.]